MQKRFIKSFLFLDSWRRWNSVVWSFMSHVMGGLIRVAYAHSFEQGGLKYGALQLFRAHHPCTLAHQRPQPPRVVQSTAARGRESLAPLHIWSMIYQTSNTPQGGSKYGAPWEGVIQELKISRRASRAASYCQEEANARWWQCILNVAQPGDLCYWYFDFSVSDNVFSRPILISVLVADHVDIELNTRVISTFIAD